MRSFALWIRPDQQKRLFLVSSRRKRIFFRKFLLDEGGVQIVVFRTSHYISLASEL